MNGSDSQEGSISPAFALFRPLLMLPFEMDENT